MLCEKALKPWTERLVLWRVALGVVPEVTQVLDAQGYNSGFAAVDYFWHLAQCFAVWFAAQ